MKVITESITRSVTTLPLQKKSCLEIWKGRGSKEARNKYDEMLHCQDRKLRWLEWELSISEVACTICPFYVLSCDMNYLSLSWLLWIGWSDSSGTTLLSTALQRPHTTSWFGIHGNIVNLEHLVWYMHLTAVGQLLWLKRYRSKTWLTFLNFLCGGLVSLINGGTSAGKRALVYGQIRHSLTWLGGRNGYPKLFCKATRTYLDSKREARSALDWELKTYQHYSVV
jgi:hypothetical protein